jgi:hypothetical protein
MNSADRVAQIQKSDLPSRLLKGATNLGEAYRAGQRCLSGFSRICPCATPTEFCQIKRKWIALAEEYYGGQPFGLGGNEPFYVVEAMTVSQFSATKLTATVEVPTGERISVGNRGTTWRTIYDLGQLQDDDAALAVAVDAVVKIQKMESSDGRK